MRRAALLALALAAPAQADELGRALYHDGAGMQARIGAARPVDGRLMPCANCHGRRGEGGAEGGTRVPPLRWAELTRSDGHHHADGRTHRAFDAASLAAAIRTGRDPDGQDLDRAMPRYTLSGAQMDALLAYLRRLGDEPEPGLAADRIRLGVTSVAAQRAVEAVVAPVRPYGRRLETCVGCADVLVWLDAGPEAAIPAARALVEALKRVGREVDRVALTRELAGLGERRWVAGE